MPDCTFDEATHTYTVDGRVVPSVTQVLKESGIIDTTYFTDPACQRGRTVAVATELYDKGTLDWDKLPDGIEPYVQAWRRFRYETDIEIREIEQPHYSQIYGYAGTPDREVLWNSRPTIPDIKTGSHAAWHALQLAAYDCFFDVPHDRVVVLLKPDGTYSIKVYDNPSDRDGWRAIVAKYHYERAH